LVERVRESKEPVEENREVATDANANAKMKRSKGLGRRKKRERAEGVREVVWVRQR